MQIWLQQNYMPLLALEQQSKIDLQKNGFAFLQIFFAIIQSEAGSVELGSHLVLLAIPLLTSHKKYLRTK